MIASASRVDSARAGAIIARAFHDDPVNLWLFGARPMAPTFAALARHIYLRRGFGDVLAGDLGAALWLHDARDKAVPVLTTLRVALAIGASAGFGAMRRGLALDAAFTGAHPAEPHAFLFAIGVVPAAQGKGLGGVLMRAGLARIDAAGLPCYLESTKAANVPIYRHYGFETLPGFAVPPGCPPVYPMWRPKAA